MGRRLDGKVVIVTGGAGAMGSWVCRMFAEQGARVVVADTGGDVEGRSGPDRSRVEAVVEQVRRDGGEAVGAVGDIADMAHAESVVRLALDTWGKLDVVVATHGILRERMIFNMTEEEWDEVVRVHLKGCFAVTKFASIYWRQSMNGGRLIYFTSTAGIRGSPGQPNYSAAHAGKIGLMLSAADGLARYNVTAVCVSPGAATRMSDRGAGGALGGITSEEAAGTRLDPKNVAPVVVYLASDEGTKVNGRVIGVTGGKVSMWREPQWDAAIFADTPIWDIDDLFRVMPETLAAGGLPRPPRQFP
jgi:NAD(P)-dependent dehydrogenase (short-subunit alcohol dehydrogenase family)